MIIIRKSAKVKRVKLAKPEVNIVYLLFWKMVKDYWENIG